MRKHSLTQYAVLCSWMAFNVHISWMQSLPQFRLNLNQPKIRFAFKNSICGHYYECVKINATPKSSFLSPNWEYLASTNIYWYLVWNEFPFWFENQIKWHGSLSSYFIFHISVYIVQCTVHKLPFSFSLLTECSPFVHSFVYWVYYFRFSEVIYR